MSCTIVVGVAVARRSVTVPVNVVVPTGGGGASPAVVNFTGQTSVHVMHNRGYKPLITVFNAFGDEVLADVNHASTNDFFVNFAAAMSGSLTYI